LIGYDQLTGAAPLAFSSGYDPDIVKLYESNYADKNPYAANFLKCPVGEVVSSEQLCSTKEMKKTPFYADLLAPSEDVIGGGGTMLAADADRMFLIGGNMRAKDRDKYEADWLRLCLTLAPVIRQSLEISRTISGLSFEKWAAGQHLLGPEAAILVVDPTMRVHYACAEAEKLLDKGTLVGGGLRHRIFFRSCQVQREFATFTRLQSRDTHDTFRSWRFADESGQQWTCRTMALRLADLEGSLFGAFLDKSISVVLLALKPETDRVCPLHRVRQMLGLSKAEATTALKLANGLTTAEIAEDRQISVHTVRNQIKAALAKTGCRRQSDLVRRVEQLRQQSAWRI
jgi:DNA-binding CsgD family transcriptional regulator